MAVEPDYARRQGRPNRQTLPFQFQSKAFSVDIEDDE